MQVNVIAPNFQPFLDSSVEDCPQALAWSDDGQLLAVGGIGGAIVVLDVEACSELARWQAHEGGLFALAWQPGSRRLASCGQDGHARVWQLVSTGAVLDFELRQATDWVEHCSWQPGGRLLAVAAGRRANVYQADGRLLREVGFEESTISAIGWRPTGAQLALAGYNSIRISSPLDPGDSPKILRWPGSMVSVRWNPAGTIVAAGCQDCTVHFWRVRDGDNSQMTGYDTKPRQLGWSASGDWLATDGSSDVTLWSFRKPGPEGLPPITLRQHRKPIKTLDFAPKGNLLLSGCTGGLICLWDRLADFEPPRIKFQSGAGVELLAWHPVTKRRMFAAACEDGDVCVYTVPAFSH